ncbi:MAG TPA: HAMP domain-containing sensor histidine kinase [Edaphobacter sp.]|nr:HAMP domain-containing sensor histidine kinase [Edaphobacter sp.]
MEEETPKPRTWAEMEGTLRQIQTTAAAGQFAAAIMHEINNPLEAISNLVYLLGIEAKNPEMVQEYSRQISEQLATVIQIARGTLSFYRSPDTMEAIDMAALADAAVRVHQPKLSAKRVGLVQEIPANATVMGHAGEILQVLSNLLSNSIDALPLNGKLTIRVRKYRKEIHLTIADNGHGIPAAIREHIFDPFFTTKKDQGTGLGLAISKGIIERHRGSIRVRSSIRLGETGTSFRISLPSHDDPKVNHGWLDQVAS